MIGVISSLRYEFKMGKCFQQGCWKLSALANRNNRLRALEQSDEGFIAVDSIAQDLYFSLFFKPLNS